MHEFLLSAAKEAEKHPGLFEKIGKYILNNIQVQLIWWYFFINICEITMFMVYLK